MTSQDSGWGIHKKKCLRWTSIGPFCGKNEAVHHHVKEYATKIVIIFIQTTFPGKKSVRGGVIAKAKPEAIQKHTPSLDCFTLFAMTAIRTSFLYYKDSE